jgi:hypothetical protein
MNSRLESTDASILNAFLAEAIWLADDIPILISIRMQNGKYIATADHPECREEVPK